MNARAAALVTVSIAIAGLGAFLGLKNYRGVPHPVFLSGHDPRPMTEDSILFWDEYNFRGDISTIALRADHELVGQGFGRQIYLPGHVGYIRQNGTAPGSTYVDIYTGEVTKVKFYGLSDKATIRPDSKWIIVDIKTSDPLPMWLRERVGRPIR
ncbi:hypothetical protein BH11ARM1_BH11ARM1_16250 [soil metagenome]